MKTTRQRILELLQNRTTASALELAQALALTPANIRHHLLALVKEGLVEPINQRPGHGRGRPTRVYALVKEISRHNLDRLASALLSETLGSNPSEDRTEMIQRIARHLRGEAPTGRGATQALNLAVRRLNEMGYQARWEAHTGGPRLILSHCPYASILSHHPEMCQIDAALLAELTGESAQQTARLKPDSRGLPQCVFLLQQQKG